MISISRVQIKQLAEKYTPEVIQTTKELIKVPSVFTVDSSDLITKKIQEISKNLGFPCQIIADEITEEKAIFVGEGFDKKDSILVTTGFGTVDLEESLPSQYDPFVPTVTNDRLYGSGAWKNKGNVALSLFYKKILTDLGFPDLIKILYNNEVGDTAYNGIRLALSRGMQAKMLVVSCPVTMDRDGQVMLYTGCRGIFKFRVSIYKQTTDVLPDIWQKKSKITNPIESLITFWSNMQDVFGDNPVDLSFPENTTNDQALLALNGGTGESIPAYVTAQISMRSVFSITNQEYFEFAKKVADEISKNTPVKFNFEILEDMPAIHVKQTKFAELYKQNLSTNLDYPVKFVNDFYLDAVSLFAERDWPIAYAISLTGKNQNSFDEYLDLKDISKYLETIVQTFLENEGVEIVN